MAGVGVLETEASLIAGKVGVATVSAVLNEIDTGAAPSVVGTVFTVTSILADVPFGSTLTEMESSTLSAPVPSAVNAPLITSSAPWPSTSSSGLSAATSSVTWVLMVVAVTRSGCVWIAPARFAGLPSGDSCATTIVVSGVTFVMPLAALAVVL